MLPLQNDLDTLKGDEADVDLSFEQICIAFIFILTYETLWLDVVYVTELMYFKLMDVFLKTKNCT